MISEKYIAGLIDSDGYFGFKQVKVNYKPQLQIVVAQRKDNSHVLTQLHAELGGSLRTQGANNGKNLYVYWTLYSTPAKHLLARISRFLVIKRTHALWCLQAAEGKVDDVEAFKQKFKESRQIKSLPLPNYPTRRWLAGYFDGDGCIHVNRIYGDNKAQIVVEITAHKNDSAGIEIIQKNFAGRIVPHSNPNCLTWRTSETGQVHKFLEYFSKHSHIKYDQLYAALAYLNAEQKDGALLKAKLKALKGLAETK